MRTLIRATLLLAGALGFSLALAAVSSADMVEPRSALQPATVPFVDEKAAAEAMPEPANAEAARRIEEQKAKAEAKAEEEEVVATPAPEQVVRQAPAHLTRPAVSEPAPSVASRVVHPLRTGLQHIGATLGRAISACEVGAVGGAGGPALTLAVLVLATPLIRRRLFGVRRAADEDVPEFLYARELTPPG